VRVGDSQVLLDVVIREFNNGAEPEAIAHGYPTLNLADVYAVIAYYLRHQNDVDQYHGGRRQEAEKLRQEIEAKQPNRAELRAKLLARKAQMDLAHASPDQ
jgi:tRNA C32,U32 (ribose-2'-O)-methylase TrmJ